MPAPHPAYAVEPTSDHSCKTHSQPTIGHCAKRTTHCTTTRHVAEVNMERRGQTPDWSKEHLQHPHSPPSLSACCCRYLRHAATTTTKLHEQGGKAPAQSYKQGPNQGTVDTLRSTRLPTLLHSRCLPNRIRRRWCTLSVNIVQAAVDPQGCCTSQQQGHPLTPSPLPRPCSQALLRPQRQGAAVAGASCCCCRCP